MGNLAPRLVAALLLVTAPAAVATTAAAAAAPAEASITFTGGGQGPFYCDSEPSVASLAISRHTRLRLVNEVGVAGLLSVGGEDELRIADGAGVSVRLEAGEHTVRLVPECLIVRAGPAVVIVTNTGPRPQASPSGAPGAPAGPPAARASAGGTQPPPVSPAPSGGFPGGAGPSRSAPASPGRAATPAGTAEGRVSPEDMTPLVDSGSDARDSWLLAVIAMICVFGVSSAIFRAIMAQRASGVVDT